MKKKIDIEDIKFRMNIRYRPSFNFFIRAMGHPAPRALATTIVLAGLASCIVAGALGIVTGGFLLPAAVALASLVAVAIGSVLAAGSFFASRTNIYKDGKQFQQGPLM